ncbi:TspO/MBR family protein [Halomarina oriensis]|uniref:Tryptophan-rich sensory protein n=1 Tax=Halomarina oriensis TaxID=671145 RepID=A0A6B0GP15_9EURY|nr:TspO/MBR family protein [Halomarina oriensis]MWG34413.1 tryptophan-rich sensory protein [Halomarina oriensis]
METASQSRLPRERPLLTLGAAVLLCELVGITGALFTATGVESWYATLNQPELAPPNWVFGPVWTTLYALMGAAAWLVWREGSGRSQQVALGLFGVQLALNFAWSFVFFGAEAILPALAVILVLLFFIGTTATAFWRIDRRAALLLVPYLAWVSFATYLSYGFWQLN